MAALVSRIYSAFNPPVVEKKPDALKFGILGAAASTPLSIIIPAKSHPQVIIQAVAARDRAKAEEYAKANGVAEVKDSYQEILDDPNIDCVIVPLVNSLHYEWASKAIRAGKHVLVEKPAVANAEEAEKLFNMEELKQPGGPVLLEAFHNRFYPSWQLFHSLVSPEHVVHVKSHSSLPFWTVKKSDIHFNRTLAGGTIMSLGTYAYAALRDVFAAAPVECISCDTQHYTDGVHANCDYASLAKFRFPNGGIGEASCSLGTEYLVHPSYVDVKHKPVAVLDDKSGLAEGQEKLRTRQITLYGLLHGVFWHRIDLVDVYEIRDKEGKTVKTWTDKKSLKAYTFAEAGGQFASLPGDTYWMSYRHQLEQFVNKIKGYPTQYWISGEDSIAQAKMVDMAYIKSGLGIRSGEKS